MPTHNLSNVSFKIRTFSKYNSPLHKMNNEQFMRNIAINKSHELQKINLSEFWKFKRSLDRFLRGEMKKQREIPITGAKLWLPTRAPRNTIMKNPRSVPIIRFSFLLCVINCRPFITQQMKSRSRCTISSHFLYVLLLSFANFSYFCSFTRVARESKWFSCENCLKALTIIEIKHQTNSRFSVVLSRGRDIVWV